MASTLSISEVPPSFVEVAKALYGDAVDVRELWDLSKGIDASTVHLDSDLTPAQKQKRNQKVAATGLAATGVAGAAGLHAVKATRVENTARAAKVAEDVYKVPRLLSKLPAKKAAAVVGAAALGLHGVELVGDTLAAHAQLSAIKANQSPKKPVAKAFRMRALNPEAVRRTVSAKVRRPGLRLTPVAKAAEWDVRGEISKVDEDKRQVFGWANVSEAKGRDVVDRQGDVVPIEELEKSAYKYVLECRIGGDQHARVAKSVTAPKHTADLIESMVFTDDKIEKMGLPSDFPRGWWVGMQVNDEPTWQLIKSGKRTGFSVHGSGRREEVELVSKGERAKQMRRRTEAAAHPPAPKLVPVSSSAIKAMGYQRQTRRLGIEMHSRPGSPYLYRVSPKQAAAAENAPSLGSHYSHEIRGKAPRATKVRLRDRARLFADPPVAKAMTPVANAAGGVIGAGVKAKAAIAPPPAKPGKPVLTPLTQKLMPPATPPVGVPGKALGLPLTRALP